jgi:hypothetical protein
MPSWLKTGRIYWRSYPIDPFMKLRRFRSDKDARIPEGLFFKKIKFIMR